MQMNKFYAHKNPNRLNVFFTMEPYPYEKISHKNFPKDFFNITMTFRRDSTILRDYGRFENILQKDKDDFVWTDSQVDLALMKKKNIALQIVSHCETHSQREKYIEELKKYLNITLYGSCYQNLLDINEKSENIAFQEHFFYFAFENSVCKDYVTEKFWRIKQLIVPVVLKRSWLNGIVDNQYFIAVDDFNSPKELAERLIYLSKNLTEYKKYLEWTKKFRKTPSVEGSEFCELCEMAVKKQKHKVLDIYKWWESESGCINNYVNRFL